MVKKIFNLICIFYLIISFIFIPTVNANDNNIKIIFNGQVISFDVQPKIINNRTMVPFRKLAEVFDADISWDENSQSILLKKDNVSNLLKIGSNIAYSIENDVKKEIILDASPVIIEGRTLVPLRYIAENFNLSVNWDNNTQSIIITDNLSKDYNNQNLLYIHFIDVGQGDGIFLQLPNKQSLLIDAGNDDNIVYNYLKKLGISKINYVVATHPHSDHIGGLPNITNNFEIENIYMPKISNNTNIFNDLLLSIKNKGLVINKAKAGVNIVSDNDLKIDFVAPVKDDYKNINDYSAVIKLQYKENTFLFSGDVESISENDILLSGYDISSDLIKIGHHGSDSSSSNSYIKEVNPKIAVISVGNDNSYGHPSKNIIDLLTKMNTKIYRTDINSTIIFTCDGNNIYFNNQPTPIKINAPPQNIINSDVLVQENNDINETIIYITKTGTKYHKDGCIYLSDSKIKTTITKAISMGLTPCSRCYKD